MTDRPTIRQIITDLDATEHARLVAVREDSGTWTLPGDDAVEIWADAREWIKILRVIDGPLQGWSSDRVVWQYALEVDGIDSPNEPFFVFVGRALPTETCDACGAFLDAAGDCPRKVSDACAIEREG
jgi:hypothetical protein